ncbi:DUF2807 domain-containing protein [Cryomorphaceae bacterium 1068]|nr:DUF2807 domain-containing protein [Cryomorphaceae bacterium 1068]
MKKIYPLLLICLIAVMSSCNLKTYKGDPTNEKRSVSEYSKIKVKGPFDVIIDPNKESGLTITAPSDAIADIETRVENGELILDLDNSGYMSPDIEVVIANSQLEGISISGSGSFEGALETKKDLDLKIGGSGNIDVQSNANRVYANISGSGNINASGTCEMLEASISGSGNMNFGKMEAQDVDVSISGSGGMKVNVTRNLEASVSGSGSITYTGSPVSVDKNVSGSGSIRKN